ncbi:MAG: glycyl-radical enzyme activating protein [Candidatus Aminicenantes bacterium]|nr:glycyl-radical enzyme activating protein [Candidatus Aminicenantes bacterium]
MSNAKGMIFDIKRFAIHDGPGIRTIIFFKGCSLQCLWCHNPEGIDNGSELMARSSRCAKCYSCVAACSLGAISRNGGPVVIDRAKCDLCGECVEVCMYEALQIAGRKVSVPEVMAEIEKDRIFYEQSGGGVTLSGGEPLSQPAFCEAILTELDQRNIPTALDTSGLAPWGVLWRSASKADLILYDLKMMDGEKHKKYTGVTNNRILDNLKKLAAAKKDIAVRIPLMAGVNDDKENIRRTIDFLKSLKVIKKIGLLSYHKGGQEKYKNLGKTDCFEIFEPPSKARMEEISQAFAGAGFTVKIGG